MKIILLFLFCLPVFSNWDAVYIEENSSGDLDQYIEIFHNGSPEYRIRIETYKTGECEIKDIKGRYVEKKRLEILDYSDFSCEYEIWNNGKCYLIMRKKGQFLSPQMEVPCRSK